MELKKYIQIHLKIRKVLLSIITVNYNDAVGLEKTIKSVQSQTYQDFEHIIIDGNSDDGSKEVIEKYKNSFGYWVSELDSGIYNAMNKGIDKAKGDYLLFLNSGDWLYDDEVLTKVNIELKESLDIYYGNLILYDELSNKRLHKPESNLRFSYFFRSSIPHQSTFIRRKLFETKKYNESLKIVADWEFFLISIYKENATYRYMDLTISNFKGGGLTSLEKSKILLRKEREDCIKRLFPSFYLDYKEYRELKSFAKLNRFKALKELENNKIAQKLNSFILQIQLYIFSSKKLKDL